MVVLFSGHAFDISPFLYFSVRVASLKESAHLCPCTSWATLGEDLYVAGLFSPRFDKSEVKFGVENS